jgi:excinuclease ABC subunit A
MSKKDIFKNGKIIVKGARMHNLKNISLELPRNKLVVITGLSGSGKSSLAFDTIYAEGQRRYVESLSSYARQFLGVMGKPDVDSIEGLSPAISIDQKSVSQNPRSTVGTITEIYDYLRLLYARVGIPHCPRCKKLITSQSTSQIVDMVLKFKKGSKIEILAPIIKDKKGEHNNIFIMIEKAGYVRVRVDGEIMSVEDVFSLDLDRYKKHSIETVVDRLVVEVKMDRARLADSVETALKIGEGSLIVSQKGEEDRLFSEKFACADCGISIQEIEPRSFSFNSPHGACYDCTGIGKKLEVDPELVITNPRLTLAEGAIKPWSFSSRSNWTWLALEDVANHLNFSLNIPVNKLPKDILQIVLYGDPSSQFEGVIPNLERRWRETDSSWARSEIEKYMVVKKCPTCKGKRLKEEVLSVFFNNKNISDLTALSIFETKKFFESVKLTKTQEKIANLIIKEILARLTFLMDVGLSYLSLSRESETLSGGEAQRIRLATQIGSRLVGVLYILDEPSIGLHSRDNNKLIKTLKDLRDLNNTVIVVEHDEETMLAADWIVEVGPEAGLKGGKIVFEGTPQELKKSKTITGQYISGKKHVYKESLKLKEKPHLEVQPPSEILEIVGARENNLKNIDVKIPLSKFVCITGVSGSGKSTLMDDILAKALAKKLYNSKENPGKHKDIFGIENINKVIHIDQSPIGRTPRSNPATYTGVFTHIRDIFANTQEAKIRGYKVGRFSFNVKGGRCESCEGQGIKKIEMHFLPDVYVECEECEGTRYNKEVLEIEYKGKNIAAVLDMSVNEAAAFFKNIPKIKNILATLQEVGIGYIKLGQGATTLSGGEAQRVKLADELSRRDTGKTFYILDEPTTGLHFDDVSKLLVVLRKLVNKGNTVLVIEHNMDVIAASDWIVDLGPDGGDKGGNIVAEGKPEEIMKIKKSYTGQFLKKYL